MCSWVSLYIYIYTQCHVCVMCKTVVQYNFHTIMQWKSSHITWMIAGIWYYVVYLPICFSVSLSALQAHGPHSSPGPLLSLPQFCWHHPPKATLQPTCLKEMPWTRCMYLMNPAPRKWFSFSRPDPSIGFFWPHVMSVTLQATFCFWRPLFQYVDELDALHLGSGCTSMRGFFDGGMGTEDWAVKLLSGLHISLDAKGFSILK